MSGRKLGLALALSLLTLTPSGAWAQSGAQAAEPYPKCTRRVEDTESQAAHAKYLSGKVDYDEGKHEAAIQQFRQAYAKDCTKHELLVIISRSYEFKGDYAEALRALETYLERVPTSPEAVTHRARIETLKGKLADQKAAAAAAPTASSSVTPPSTPPSNGDATVGPSVSGVSGDRREHTVYPWLFVGAGIVAATVGVVLLATVPENPSNCNPETEKCSNCPGQPPVPGITPTCPKELTPDELAETSRRAGAAKDQGLVGGLVLGGGAVFIVGGLLWHFLEPTGPRPGTASARLSPQMAPGYAGLALGGRF